MRLRLDLFWENRPQLPSTFQSNTVHVPRMSRCGGVCDKFAVGDRVGMQKYFTRMKWFHWNFRKHHDSESYLSATSRLSQYRIVRHDWMFCKYGSWPRAWRECTQRVRLRQRCEGMTCGWCSQGCRCWNSTCTTASNYLKPRSKPSSKPGTWPCFSATPPRGVPVLQTQLILPSHAVLPAMWMPPLHP